jgi:hypothetical protein
LNPPRRRRSTRSSTNGIAGCQDRPEAVNDERGPVGVGEIGVQDWIEDLINLFAAVGGRQVRPDTERDVPELLVEERGELVEHETRFDRARFG